MQVISHFFGWCAIGLVLISQIGFLTGATYEVVDRAIYISKRQRLSITNNRMAFGLLVGLAILSPIWPLVIVMDLLHKRD